METKLDLTKPVRMRDGREVVIYCTDAPGECPIHGRVVGYNVGPTCWTADGRYVADTMEPSGCDLINVPEPEEVRYVNIYGKRIEPISPSSYFTRAVADRYAESDRTACVRVVYRHGQFDE